MFSSLVKFLGSIIRTFLSPAGFFEVCRPDFPVTGKIFSISCDFFGQEFFDVYRVFPNLSGYYMIRARLFTITYEFFRIWSDYCGERQNSERYVFGIGREFCRSRILFLLSDLCSLARKAKIFLRCLNN